MKFNHIGIHSGSNLGDEAITYIIGRWLERNEVDVSRCHFSPKKYGAKNIFLNIFRMIFNVAKKSKGATVIIGGGNLLMSIDFIFPVVMFIHVLVGKIFGDKVILFCVGVGPFYNRIGTMLIKASLIMADEVIVRDIRSLNLVNSLGVESDVLPDPVFTFARMCNHSIKEVEAIYDVGISVMPIGSELISLGGSEIGLDNFKKSLVETIRALLISGKRIKIFITDVNKDVQIYDYLKKTDLINCVEFEVPKNYMHLFQIIRGCKMILATRMHSAIFALSENKPVCSIAWQDKVLAMHEVLSLSDSCVALNSDFSFSSQNVLSVFDGFEKNIPFFHSKISVKMDLIFNMHNAYWISRS